MSNPIRLRSARTTIAGVSVVAGALLLTGQQSSADAARPGAAHAHAVIRNTTGESIGFARFVEDASGALHVNVKVDGIDEGLHGIHIHNTAACTPTFAAAGSHHNPLGATHGHHSGDLPNLVVNGEGRGRLNAVTREATLSPGTHSVFDANGSAIVIHASPDDFQTDPTGNSGARIACGVIELG
jgi:superoxide dismutase, Cu-Zn family